MFRQIEGGGFKIEGGGAARGSRLGISYTKKLSSSSYCFYFLRTLGFVFNKGIMAPWTHLIRFTAAEDGDAYYATCTEKLPQVGENVAAFKLITSLGTSHASNNQKTIKEVSMPNFKRSELK